MKNTFLTLATILYVISFQAISQCIVINEIMIDGGACDGSCNPSTSEWVELYNTCGSTVDLSCFILADGDWTYVVPDGTLVASNSFITIGGAANEGSSPDLFWDDAIGSYIGTFTNSGEQLALFDSNGDFVDGIIWGGGQNLQDNTNPVDNSGSCSVTNVELPNSSDSKWEDIVTDGTNGSTMARSVDGGSTWENRTGSDMTFGTSNGGAPMTLVYYEPVSLERIELEENVSILKVFDITGDVIECDIKEKGVYIIIYSNHSVGKLLYY